MIKKFGHMLLELRKKEGITAKDLARGLLSEAELSRLENGRKEVDFIILESLFERLGKSLDKLELALDEEEYALIKLRIQIAHELERYAQETDGSPMQTTIEADITKLLQEYRKETDQKKPIHRQYAMMIGALLEHMKGGGDGSALESLQEARKVSLPDGMKAAVLLSNQEIILLCMIAYLQTNVGQETEAENLLAKLEHYIDSRYQDGEERVKVYPQCAYVYGRLLYKARDYRKAARIVEKGLKTLAENGSMTCVMELLEQKRECAVQGQNPHIVRECEQYRAAFSFLYEITETPQHAFELFSLMECSTLKECINSNRFLRQVREAANLSQEALCDEICSQETLARIEGGRNANRKKLYRMWKKTGIQRERYYGQIEADSFELYEKVRLRNRYCGQEMWEEEYLLLDELEKQLDLSLLPNRQYIEAAKMQRLVRERKMTNREAIEALEKLLYLTMPPMESQGLVYRVPFRVESSIINQLARNYRAIGEIEQAIRLYQAVRNLDYEDKIGMMFHARTGLALYINYQECLEINDQIDDSERIGKEGLIFFLNCKRGDCAGMLMANLDCLYDKKQEPLLEEQCLKNSCFLLRFYRMANYEKMIKEVYISKYGEAQLGIEEN